MSFRDVVFWGIFTRIHRRLSEIFRVRPTFLGWGGLGVALVLLIVGIIRFRYLQVPLERDEGEFAYMGRLILEGVPPYKAAYNMKFPGIYYLYALAMAGFGQTITGIHMGLWLLNNVATVMVYFLGKRLVDVTAGIVACALFGLMTVSPSLQGTSAHATQFFLPFVLGGFLLLLRNQDRLPQWRLLASGTLLGLAVSVKQHAALFAIFGLLFVMFDWGSTSTRSWREKISDALILAAGMAAPMLVISLALAWNGLFARFWFWTVVYARQYVVILTPKEAVASFLRQAPGAMAGWAWAILAVAVGAIILIRAKHLSPVRSILLSFFLFSFLSVCPGFYFRNHYFVTLVPAMALLAGITGSSLAQALNRRWRFQFGGTVVFAIAMVLPMGVFSSEFFTDSEITLSRTVYPYACFAEMKAIGEHLKVAMRPGDQLGVLGSEPELFFYANCYSASGYLYTYPLMEPQPFAEHMQNEMIGELESSNPRFMVVVDNNSSWLRQRDSNLRIFQWMQDFLGKHYHLIEATRGLVGSSSIAKQLDGSPMIFLWERNEFNSNRL